METKLEEKIKGCLVGATIGAELGLARMIRQEKFVVKNPEDIFKIDPERVTDYREEEYRASYRSLTPFIRLGVEAYLNKKGRIVPEDFADLLKSDKDVCAPVFAMDNIHTVQEILKEGMHPRLSGLGVTPMGFICASMPAVGIYHAANPEYAYIDAVEIASVTQPKIGADWAGLCAAAIAYAFAPEIKTSDIVEQVMSIAYQNNKELFYQLDYPLRHISWIPNQDKEGIDIEFLRWWHSYTADDWGKMGRGLAPNPIFYVLPAIKRFGTDTKKIMNLLLIPGNSSSIVSPVIAGAILGTLGGMEIFPQEWLRWAQPITKPWLPITDIVKNRLAKESCIIKLTEKLNKKENEETSLLFDKIYGCLLAGSIGNAMGSPVEGKFYWEIDKEHPGGIKSVLDPKRLESEDDNQMAMLLVETYIKRQGHPVTARHFGKTWKERLNKHHFYYNCMGSAYEMIMDGWDPRVVGHWKQVTGSTVMCMEPVGIYHLLDPEFSWIDATEISYMYQRGLDVIAASILAVTVAEAFNPEATVESVCRTALSVAPKQPLKTFDNRTFKSCYDYIETCLEIAEKYDDVMEVRKPLYEKCLFYHPIDPLEVIGLSLAIFKTAKGDIRQAAIGGTNIGRDSDTIAGRAAMLSGILQGARKVPSDWLNLFKPQSLERIRINAEKLLDVINKKLINMQNRQKLI